MTDGLKVVPEALGAVFPATTLQTCIEHLIRNSLDYGSSKDRKLPAVAIKPIDTALSAEAAQAELDVLEQSLWGRKFSTVVAVWRRAWSRGHFPSDDAATKLIWLATQHHGTIGACRAQLEGGR